MAQSSFPWKLREEKGISFKFDTKDSLMIVTDRKGFFAKEEKGHAKVKYREM